LIASPFFHFFGFGTNENDKDKIDQLHEKELEYFMNHKQENVMWQFKYSNFDKSIVIEKSFKHIYNTTKPPISESIN
jgi:hypothetical protein